MTIEYANTSCDFVDLWAGDAFVLYKDGERYTCMKITGIEDEDYNHFYNAVHLATGEVYEIEAHQKVERINARIIVE